jgi:hypothetical protein
MPPSEKRKHDFPKRADKLELRKRLEDQYYPRVKAIKRDDLLLGTWFKTFLDRALGAMANPTTPNELRERHAAAKTPDALADAAVRAQVDAVMHATDAYEEVLGGHDIRILKEKKPGGPDQKLTGDAVAVIAELFFAMDLAIGVVFEVGAAHEKLVNAGATEMFEEVFGRARGAFDYDAAKKAGNASDQIGAKIYERVIGQTVALPPADAQRQRKGFYTLHMKAVAKETARVVEKLPKWEPPKPTLAPGDAAAGMMSGSPDDADPMAAY